MKKVLASNKSIGFNYEVLDKLEAGIVLLGWEVKAIKNKRTNMENAYVIIRNNEVLLKNLILPLNSDTKFSDKSLQNRDKKLLLNKREIFKINQAVKIPGSTCVPLNIYLNDGNLVKIEIAIVRGRKKFDKRDLLKKRDMQKQINIERKKYNF